jgi:hypothetical protein
MTTLTEAYANLRTTILKHRTHVQAVTKRQCSTQEEATAINAVAAAYNACFHIISGGKSSCLEGSHHPP